MSKKEELIKRLCGNVKLVMVKTNTEGSFGEITPMTMGWIYDEIRASILTPKVVALLKAIGSKPTGCHECDHYDDEWDCCSVIHKGANYYKNCPLLSSEELAEITGGDR